MILYCRDFDKDSKKVFICYFRIFLQFVIEFPSLLQKFKNKTNIADGSLVFALGALKELKLHKKDLGRSSKQGKCGRGRRRTFSAAPVAGSEG